MTRWTIRGAVLHRAVLACVLGAFSITVLAASPDPMTPPPVDGADRHGDISLLPLSFEENFGLAGPTGEVQFVANGKSYGIALTREGAVLAIGEAPKNQQARGKNSNSVPDVIQLELRGARTAAQPAAEDPLPGKVNYYIGNDPAKWRTGIATYGKVRYSAVYPGVDLVYYGNQGHLEYDFDVAPAANPHLIGMYIKGADRVRLDTKGNLAIDVHGRRLAFERPVAYQWAGEHRVAVPASYRLAGKTVRFQVGAYDRRKPLIIDPTLSFFSYLGGSGNDSAGDTQANGISVQGGPNPLGLDPHGNVYVVGTTGSLDFPTKKPFASAPAKVNCNGCTWAFVTSISPNGTTLNYSTYLGGTLGSDTAASVAVDASGNAYLVGSTYSNDFPVTAGAFQTICGPTFNDPTETEEPGCNYFGPDSAFVTKLSSSGALVASTFLGAGAGSTGPSTIGTAIAIDSADRVYVVGTTLPGLNIPHGASGGYTQELAFPVTANALLSPPPFTTANDGVTLQPQDAFVSVFNSSLTTLLYSTLYGDTQVFNPNVNQETKITNGFAVAVDATGNFYVGGITQDGYLPITASSVQPKASSCGALDAYGNISGDQGPACNFVAKFSPVTTASGAPANPSLVYGTYLGGVIGIDGAQPLSGIAANAAGDLYVLGTTNNTPGFPTTPGSYQPTCTTSCWSAFISEINPTGTKLLASTLYGGTLGNAYSPDIDRVFATSAIVLDQSDNVYITGLANSLLEQVNPITRINNAYGSETPFVAKFNSTLSSLLFATVLNATPYPENTGYVHAGGGLAVDVAGDIFVAGSSTGGVYVGTTETTPGVFQPNFGGGIGGYPTDAFVAKIVVSALTARGVQTDYQGEGKADYTVWRPATGEWYSIDGSGHSLSAQWGAPSDLPLIGDFDGDGKSDLAAFRPSTGYWYITQSSSGAVVAKQWGYSTDTPVAGDFDGDGKTDLAVFRSSTGGWYIVQSSNGAVVSKQWGEPGDTPVTGDFDGDGKSDIAVYRPSNGYWYIVQSSNGQVVSKQWGEAGDIPVARDYDGDGKTDIAVWRPSTGYWYGIQSSTGDVVAQQWGAPTDVPVNSLSR